MECDAKEYEKDHKDHDAPDDPAPDLRGRLIVTVGMPEVRLSLRL